MTVQGYHVMSDWFAAQFSASILPRSTEKTDGLTPPQFPPSNTKLRPCIPGPELKLLGTSYDRDEVQLLTNYLREL